MNHGMTYTTQSIADFRKKSPSVCLPMSFLQRPTGDHQLERILKFENEKNKNLPLKSPTGSAQEPVWKRKLKSCLYFVVPKSCKVKNGRQAGETGKKELAMDRFVINWNQTNLKNRSFFPADKNALKGLVFAAISRLKCVMEETAFTFELGTNH